MDIFSRVLYAPRVDLTIAVLGTLVSAVVGGAIGALVGYYEGAARPGAARSAPSSCALRTCCRPSRSSSSPSRWSPCSARACRSIVLAIAFVNVPIYLRLMRSQVLSIRRLRYVEAAYIAGASDLGDPVAATSSPTPSRPCWRSSPSISAGRCC